jgi:hypothetical protein
MPPASKECVFFSASSRLARVRPFTPLSCTTWLAACWNRSVDTQPHTPKPLAFSTPPTYFT